MQKLHFSVKVNAPKEKVWDTMLGEESYKQWTDVFMERSYYEGSWSQGSKIRFLAPDEEGNMQGMVSRIKENREYEYVSIEHLGFIQNGEEETSGDWAGALENYTFREKNGQTEVLVDMDTEEEYAEMFQEMWPKALEKLKKLAETKS
ncbi:SRPBCC domain-containing protein [Aliifodinibius sp. S!AR15-10]|uniref:SRPBCC family protein n=1 Tax=Aliifodinibius sp. S!AR15-10 TaxID=2950437 RepID=UPI002858DDE8|nr:SRPBCC domain-containing protein [Aliifodinibius sp. S!AR15-10]MDR8393731.1 SRPBCC domain-containing protein [Aliifodinibius sp. S!AR15-10]